ncbi:MAG: hypothetical protein WAV09_03420 [Minisyncoccia bacterium]
MSDPSKKMCPFLTAGVLRAAPVKEGVTDASVPLDAMPCQGNVCAMWMTIADDTGKLTKSGNCAVTLAAVALGQMNTREQTKIATKIVKG